MLQLLSTDSTKIVLLIITFFWGLFLVKGTVLYCRENFTPSRMKEVNPEINLYRFLLLHQKDILLSITRMLSLLYTMFFIIYKEIYKISIFLIVEDLYEQVQRLYHIIFYQIFPSKQKF